MSRPIKIEFIHSPEINPHWQYCVDDESFLAVGGKEKFCDAAKDAVIAIGDMKRGE